MDMRFWLERAETEAKELRAKGVDDNQPRPQPMEVPMTTAMRFGLVLCVGLTVFACVSARKEPSDVSLGGPLSGLTREQQGRFDAGRQVFQRVFSPTTGLGPFFNSTSCAECHEKPAVGGHGAGEVGGTDVETHATRFVAPATCDTLTAAGGPVFRQHAVQGAPPPIPADAQMGRRTTPMLFGRGLIDAIPDEAILAREGAAGGRAHRLPDGRVGRFGRKAEVATLREFTTLAFAVEHGIEVPRELSEIDRDLATDYMRFLAPPVPGRATRDIERGAEIFERIGCAECHTPMMLTGGHAVAALSRRPVALYSDLLLHDMGPGLADVCLGQARPSEFRTEPLMGLRLRSVFLHDGRAVTLESAIVQHGGRAQKAADAFVQLPSDERRALLGFLRTL